MKILKWTLALVGLVGLVAGAIYLLGPILLENERLLASANSNKSGNLFASPMQNIWIAWGLGAAGGLLAGLGLGLPGRTSGSIRKAALDEAAAKRSSEIAARATKPLDPAP